MALHDASTAIRIFHAKNLRFITAVQGIERTVRECIDSDGINPKYNHISAIHGIIWYTVNPDQNLFYFRQ